MIPDRVTVFPNLPRNPLGDATIQFQFSRDDRLGEISFADEIWHYVHLGDGPVLKKEKRIAQTRLLFPKTRCHFREETPLPVFVRLRKSRETGIRIWGRAMAHDQQGGIRSGRHTEEKRPT